MTQQKGFCPSSASKKVKRSDDISGSIKRESERGFFSVSEILRFVAPVCGSDA